jgi:hypothetical protein
MSSAVSDAVLTQILAKLDALQVSQQSLQAKVRIYPFHNHNTYADGITRAQVDALTNPNSPPLAPASGSTPIPGRETPSSPSTLPPPLAPLTGSVLATAASPAAAESSSQILPDKEREKTLYPQRVILTSKSHLL